MNRKFVVAWILDPLERAGSTLLEHVAAVILPVGALGTSVMIGHNWLVALDSGIFAAVLSLVTSYGTGLLVPKLAPKWDFVWRLSKTFLQSLMGSMIAANVVTSVVHFGWAQAATLAFSTTLGAAVKGGVAMGLNNTAGASLLPMKLSTSLQDLIVPDDLSVPVDGLIDTAPPDLVLPTT